MTTHATRHPGQSNRARARLRRAGTCRTGHRRPQISDSLGEGLGFRDDG